MTDLLQNEAVRNFLHLEAAQHQHEHYQEHNQQHDDFVDDEDLFEMLEMQEECQNEMMKLYFQSQNPELFENLYNDVSYGPSTTTRPAAPPPENKTAPAPAEEEVRFKIGGFLVSISFVSSTNIPIR